MENLISNIPVSSAVLKTFLGGLKYPKNKISDLEKRGALIRLKRDLYIKKSNDIQKELIASHLYGVSYISLETALAWYNMIPERVYAVRSITLKRSKIFITPLGYFDYTTVSDKYFSIGIRLEIVESKYAFLIAEPTKAICDMIIATPNLRLQSVKAMQNYLTDDLRIDFDDLKQLDKDIVRRCIEAGKKRNQLKAFEKFLNQIEN